MKNIKDKVVVITGGAGLLGRQYVQAIRDIEGIPVVLDTDPEAEEKCRCLCINCNITQPTEVHHALQTIISEYSKVPYGLINNAAIDPKFGDSNEKPQSRLEEYSVFQWNAEIAVGLTGAFLCTQVFGERMALAKSGSIINISSVLGHVAPNQALYRKDGISNGMQPVKPVTYSVIKHGIIGLTRYTATYWANKGVRCNALSPGGVYNNHSEQFVEKLSKYIPMGRMAERDEYNEAIKFLISDASSFMTGAVLNIDGGQTTW